MAARTYGVLAETLDELARRLAVEIELKTAEVWDGPWHTLQDPGRLSVAMPAALVSLNTLELSHLARRRYHPGQIRAATGGNPPNEFPAPGQGAAPGDNPPASPAPAPHVRIEIGVTLLAADPKSSDRAARVAHLAEAAVPVLVGYALEGIRGTNLYTKALYGKGLAGFLLVGHRDVELAPSPLPRTLPQRVDLVDGSGDCPEERETLYTRSAA